MKKGVLISVFLIVLLAGVVSATCDLSVNLLNQDPYPATPGDYVKVVFQMNGTQTTDCDKVFLDVVPKYPFSLDSSDSKVVVTGGNFINNYATYILVAYKLRVDKNAVDGDNKLTVNYGMEGKTSATLTKDFNINIKDARTDFEVSVQSYDAAKNTVTFGVINVGKYDAESLTLEIPAQENIKPKGSNIAIVGSLNSNDDTTASIEATPKAGEITLNLSYNDQNNVRRTLEKKVYFTSNFIENGIVPTTRDKFFYMFWVLLAVFVLYLVWGWYQRRKARNSKLNQIRR
jgi:hypothetical protein